MVVILELQEFLKKDKTARKIFGRMELEIVLKQLEGIKLSQSEKNRLSRDIRPKLRLIKDISRFEDEFELKKDADNLRLVEKAVNLILEDELKHSVKAILLFGSHAKGEATKMSDVDIAVEFDKIPDLITFIHIEGILEKRLGKKVDLVRKEAIRKELKEGILNEMVAI